MATRITILCAERTRREPVIALTSEYLDRLDRYGVHVQIEECPPCRGRSAQAQAAEQSAQLLERIRTDDTVVLLDEQGTAMTSEAFARLLDRLLMSPARRVVFVVGGPWGVTSDVRSRADAIVSLGLLTLPHEIARIVLCEQLYRALSILRGEPYHHGER